MTVLSRSSFAGREILVAPNGSDEKGRGTLASPFRSIQGAARGARAGDVISLRGGRYTKSRATVTLKGTKAQPIRIRAYREEKPILDGTENGPRAQIEDEKNKHKIVSVLDLRYSQHVIVEGLEVSGSEGFGISLWNSDYITVRNCKIHDTWSRALGGSGRHILYFGNELWNAVLMNSWGQVLKDREKGIQSYWACATDTWFLEDGTPSRDVVWKRNKVHSSWGEGIDANHVDGARIEENEVYDTYSVLIYVDHSRNVVARGNKLYNNSDWYIREDTRDRPAGILISSEFYNRPAPMMVENIKIENNLISNVSVGVGFWKDPANQHWTNKYRGIQITGNQILDSDVVPINIRKIEESSPSKSKNLVSKNLIFAAKQVLEGKSAALSLRVDDPGLWQVEGNTFINGIEGLRPSDFRSFRGNTVHGAKGLGVRLRDFRPKTSLHVAETEVLRAKYPVIDVHTHINDALYTTGPWTDPAKLVETMDRLNLKRIVILTGAWGERLQKVIDHTVKPYPERFAVYTQLDWSRVDESSFVQDSVRQIEDAVSRGAKGLKLLKEFGLYVRYKNGKLVEVDDPKFDPIWEACGRLKIPVAIYTSDPEAFFHPIDGTNERFEELGNSPSWSFSDRTRFPTREALLAARDRVFARHRGTTFVALHIANEPEDLDYVSRLLRAHPNVYTEFGARQAELGRQPRRALQFFSEFQDRIMFGTDWGFKEAQYRNYFRWLETDDEYFRYWDWPAQGLWSIYGLKLSDEILRKVYHRNAERVLGL